MSTSVELLSDDLTPEEIAAREAAERRHRLLVRVMRTALFALALFTAALVFRLTHMASSYTTALVLSDALVVPGMGITCVGLISLAGYYGSLDIISYYIMRSASFRSKDSQSEEERRKRSIPLSQYSEERQLRRVFPTHYFLVGVPLALASLILAVL